MYSLAFNPDGKILAAGGRDGIRLWDVKAQKQVGVLQAGWVSSIAFSPDGKWLASVGSGTILLWKVNLPGPTSVEAKGKRFIT